jgi:hypothetical protein
VGSTTATVRQDLLLGSFGAVMLLAFLTVISVLNDCEEKEKPVRSMPVKSHV